MAPRKAKNPGKSARYYRDNPEARAKKNAYQRKRNKSEENREYRSELNAERRKRGIYGKGGPDMSHTKSGRLVAESPKRNRARNGANGKSTKK
jgi:ribosomal protein S4